MPENMEKSMASNPGNVSRSAPLSLAAVLFAAAAGGCFNPNITNGGFNCVPDAGGKCPEGFYCHPTGRCYKPDTGPVDCGSIALCSDPPLANQECNLACQTGCGCGQRCNVTASGPRCVGTSTPAKGPGDICHLTNGNTAGFDDCAPGLICLRENCGSNLNRCYRLCSSNANCGGDYSCNIPVDTPAGTTVMNFSPMACEVPRQDCDPIANTGCPAGLACFLLNSGNTLCDCPPATGAEGTSCTFYYDCKPPLTCVGGASGGSTCRSICSTSGTTCAMGTMCKAVGVSTKFGSCQ